MQKADTAHIVTQAGGSKKIFSEISLMEHSGVSRALQANISLGPGPALEL